MPSVAMLAPAFDAIPVELRQHPRWVVWKGAKVPFCATAICGTASVNDPGTWATFEQTQTAYEEGGYEGVGFVLAGDGIVGVDLDKCVHDGRPSAKSMELLAHIGCRYIELSPSGSGLRGFGYGEQIAGARGVLDGVNVELYATKRYLTVTGHRVVQGPLVKLPRFSEVAQAIRPRDLQKRTEDDRCNLLSSSVGIPPNVLPAQEGQRNRCLFEFARFLRGKTPDATKQELRVQVARWHELALPVIGTKDFATTWADFLNGWEKVRQPYGATMQTIVTNIDHTERLPNGIESLGYGKASIHLVRLCMALQSHQGNAAFFISARQAGEVLGVHFTDASKMLSALVADGVLALVSKGSGNVASRYRYIWTQSKTVG